MIGTHGEIPGGEGEGGGAGARAIRGFFAISRGKSRRVPAARSIAHGSPLNYRLIIHYVSLSLSKDATRALSNLSTNR